MINIIWKYSDSRNQPNYLEHIGGAVGGAFLAVIFPVKWEKNNIAPASESKEQLYFFIALAIFLCYKGMTYV